MWNGNVMYTFKGTKKKKNDDTKMMMKIFNKNGIWYHSLCKT